MPLQEANVGLVLSYILNELTPFGTDSTGPASLDFSWANLDVTPITGWDQLFAEQFVLFATQTFTGNTNTNTTITSVSSFTNLSVGQVITGANIPAGTTITALNPGGNSLTISQAATGSASGSTFTVTQAPVGLTGNIVAGGSLTVSTNYYYKVTATGIQGGASPIETIASNEAGPFVPTTGNQSVTLSWTACPQATGYNIYRGTSSGAENLLVGQVPSLYPAAPVTTFTDTGFAGSSQTPPSSPPAVFVEFSVQSFTNLVGESVTLTGFLGLMALCIGGTCNFGPGNTNPLTSFFNGTTPSWAMTNGGCGFFADAASGLGWAITNTHKTFRITNTGGTAVTAQLAMVGSTGLA